MEQILSLLQALSTISPLGVIALLGLIIWMLVKAKGAKEEVDASIASISDNHLSGLPEMAESLKRIEALLLTVNDNITYLRGRLNGKDHF